jgi:hypothetical protein
MAMSKERKGKREPRPAMAINLPATFAEAQEAEIFEVMKGWPDRMVEKLKAAGLGDISEAGHALWRAKFEHELATSRDPDTLATVAWLAETGHQSAREVLRTHATRLLEDGKADLPSSVRTYLIRLINGLVPSHPVDRSEVITNMIRDIAIIAMVDAAVARWSLPRLNSGGQRHSAAYLAALVWTNRGIPLSERQVRRICQTRTRLAERLAKFLLGAARLDGQTI